MRALTYILVALVTAAISIWLVRKSSQTAFGPHQGPHLAVDYKKRFSFDDMVKYHDLYRAYMNDESALINNRMTWLLTINGFLYASLSLMVTKPRDHAVEDLIVVVLCFVGALISFLCWLAIIDAKKVAKQLCYNHEKSWPLAMDEQGCFFQLENGWRLPQISGAGLQDAQKIGSQASKLIPWVLILGWAVVLVVFLSVSPPEPAERHESPLCGSVLRAGDGRLLLMETGQTRKESHCIRRLDDLGRAEAKNRLFVDATL